MGLDAGEMAGLGGHIPIYSAHPDSRDHQRKGHPWKSRFGKQFSDIRTADHRIDYPSRYCRLQERRKTALAMGLAKGKRKIIGNVKLHIKQGSFRAFYFSVASRMRLTAGA